MLMNAEKNLLPTSIVVAPTVILFTHGVNINLGYKLTLRLCNSSLNLLRLNIVR